MFKKLSSRLVGEPKTEEEEKGSDNSFSSEKMSSAASAAATSMMGFMKKAQTAATDIVKDSPKEDGEAKVSTTSSMMGFMKKAQSAASEMVKEGTAKAVDLKNKAVQAADMDALQKKLGTALDVHTADVDITSLNFTYVTPNIIAMGFPGSNAVPTGSVMRYNPIDSVAYLLNSRHNGRYMIWNLSEEPYEYSKFQEQVLEFKFPGHPAPPLGLLFRICTSMESWLEADPNNVAAVHCLTGKGRTGTVIACYLAWTGQFLSPMEALQYVSEKRNTSIEKITIPSQRRYIQYFTNMMDGVKPRSSPLLLRRVIMNTIPVFSTRKSQDEDGTEIETSGCSPYLQIFKGGKLVFTTTWKDTQEGNGVQWAGDSDGSLSFPIENILQGDVLIRCRHLSDSGKRVSMFRAAFHTGYIPMGILRLTKAQLDGACQDSRFADDFFIDFIFAPVQTSDQIDDTSPRSEGVEISDDDKAQFDDMLNRDEKFWIDIADRKKRIAKSKKLTTKLASSTTFSISGETEPAENAPMVTKEETKPVARKGSWGDDQDAELLAQLESISVQTTVAEDTKPFVEEEEKKEEGVLNNDVPVVETEVNQDLDFLDEELADLSTMTAAADETGDIDFVNDDFDELEQYLNELSSS